MNPRLRPFVPWALRVPWVLLPLVAGPAFAASLRPTSPAIQTTASVMLWVVWAVTLLATLIPAPATLAAVRVIIPAAPVAAAWAVATDRPSTLAVAGALVGTVAAAVVALSPAVGRAFVNGPAYPNEQRHLLRLPGALILGPVPLAWAITVAAPTATVLLAAAGLWFGAVAAAVVLGPAAVVAAQSLYRLTQRWLVLVPAGLVLRDGLALTEPVLFRRTLIETLRPAPADSDSLDLTGGAAGLALELVLTEKVPMSLVKAKERTSEAGASARLLVTPTRPGAVLADAAMRDIPNGSSTHT